MQFTSDFQEKDIVYGGDKKLKPSCCSEAKELFPLAKGISVLSECPVGLIGDDINSVAKKMSAKELDMPIIPCNCEGFRGVSQSLGHHISNDTIRDYIIETREFAEPPRPLRHRPDRRLQHRRRRLVGQAAAGGDRPQREGHLDRRRRAGAASPPPTR